MKKGDLVRLLGIWVEDTNSLYSFENDINDVEMFGIVLGNDGINYKVKVYWQDTQQENWHYKEELEVVSKKG